MMEFEWWHWILIALGWLAGLALWGWTFDHGFWDLH